MHNIKLFLFLTLLPTILFCETNDTKPKSNQSDKASISDYQKNLQDNISKALGPTMPFDEELFNYLYDQAPQEIKDCVELIRKAYDKDVVFLPPKDILPKRMLLVGPPGTGKSTLARAITYRLDMPYYFIKMPLLGNEYRNSELSALSNIIEGALKYKKPLIIILDEINVITEKRSNGHESSDPSIASALWLLLDTVAKSPDILVIATANDVSKLPEPLKDRFEGNIFEIYSNNEKTRSNVLLFHLWKDMHYFNFSESYLIKLARKTAQFSPRQLEMLVRIAHQQQFLLTGSINGVTEEQLEYAYQKILKSSNILKSKSHFNIKKWINENGPLIHTISSSVSLGVALFNICYFMLGSKNARNAQPA
jgi:SpoVK/Ycf46/Vps4 family AAA+-type ATPase